MNIDERDIIESLAKELSHYKLYEVSEIVKVITPYFKLLHKKILESNLNLYEKEYAELLKEQNQNLGTKKYFETGLKIAANKAKRRESQLTLNNYLKDEIYVSQKAKIVLLNRERDFLVNFIKQHHDFQTEILPTLKEMQTTS